MLEGLLKRSPGPQEGWPIRGMGVFGAGQLKETAAKIEIVAGVMFFKTVVREN